MKVIDLTHTIKEGMPVFPGTEPPKLDPASTFEKDGFRETLLTMYSHTGTHMDAPAHIFQDGTTLDKIDVINFIGKAALIDCTSIVENEEIEYDLIERDQRVDKDSIEKARMVLKKNQERLVVDNELFTEEKKTRDEKTRLLSSDERDFLKILLDGGEVRTKINELEGKFISVSLLIESINNKAIEEIGDSIIEEGDEPYLVEDYLIEAKEFLGK